MFRERIQFDQHGFSGWVAITNQTNVFVVFSIDFSGSNSFWGWLNHELINRPLKKQRMEFKKCWMEWWKKISCFLYFGLIFSHSGVFFLFKLHPRKLRWQMVRLKISSWKRRNIYPKSPILGFHLSFRRCTSRIQFLSSLRCQAGSDLNMVYFNYLWDLCLTCILIFEGKIIHWSYVPAGHPSNESLFLFRHRG